MIKTWCIKVNGNYVNPDVNLRPYGCVKQIRELFTWPDGSQASRDIRFDLVLRADPKIKGGP